MLTIISSTLAFCHLTWATSGVRHVGLKSFPLQSLISSFMELLRTLIAYKRLPLVFCSASECVRPCSEFVFPGIGGKGGGGWGLLVLAFFYRPHRMQVSWLQVLSVLWQVICAVLFQSAAIRMHCDATGVWLKKVVFPQVFGVVVVGGKAMSNRLSVEEMALCSFK